MVLYMEWLLSEKPRKSKTHFFLFFVLTYVTCSAILALLDKDDDLRARHELLNTERNL